jgi:hypothetical protein
MFYHLKYAISFRSLIGIKWGLEKLKTLYEELSKSSRNVSERKAETLKVLIATIPK